MVSPRMTPWSATASMVFSGAVFTVSGRDKFDDVTGVVVLGVLDAGGGPQRALLVGAGRGQRVPAVAGEGLLVQPGRPAGRWRSRPRPSSDSASGVPMAFSRLSISVSTRETKNEATEWIWEMSWPLDLACSSPVEVGVHHGAVPVEGEDQRDVDADALGDHRGDRRQPGEGGRDLDQHVRPVDDLGQFLGLRDGGRGVVRQPRVDLDGHPAVDMPGGLEDRGEQVAGVPDVVGGDLPDGVVDARRRGRPARRSASGRTRRPSARPGRSTGWW